MKPKWSFFAYLAGDNDLSAVIQNDVAKIETANPAKVLAIYQADLPNQPTKRKVIGKAGPQNLGGITTNLNSGDHRTLAEFLTEAKKHERTKNIVVHFAGHGTGFVDFTFESLAMVPNADRGLRKSFEGLSSAFFERTIDETVRRTVNAMALGPDTSVANTVIRDFLDNQELEMALTLSMNGDAKYDIIACDACLMGMVEVAHQFRKVGKYFVASQDDILNDAWPLDQTLAAFSDRLDPKDLAEEIVKLFAANRAADPKATLSAVDLDCMDKLAKALDALGALILPLAAELANQVDLKDKALAFANPDYVDLYGLAKQIQKTLGAENEKIEDAAEEVCDAVKDAVIKTNGLPGANGLSIYLPDGPIVDEYNGVSLTAAAPNWHKFVAAYGDQFQRP